MAIKIYGPALASCTQRVTVVARELGVPFQLVDIDFSNGEHKSAEYLKKQPFGQFPYLEDDGFILFESRAISRYLAVAHGGGKLIPKGVKENAIFEQGASIEQNDFDSYAGTIARERAYVWLFNRDGNEAKAAAAQADLEKKLDAYEVILAKQNFIGGNELTVADLFHLPQGHMVATETKPGNGVVNFNDPKRPNVARWWNHISNLPSWKATLADSKVALEAFQKK